MPSAIETLLQSLKPGTDAALDKAGYTPGAGAFVVPTPTVAPMADVMPQLSPTAQYIQDMQTLMRGGVGKLSTGEKIGAVGQILQAVGSRGAADPGAVIQNVRQQQMQKLNAQYQIAQLQQKMEQDAKKRTFIQQYASALPEEKRGVLENADTDEAFKIVQEEAFRQKQVFNRDRDPVTGNVRLTFGDGSFVVTNQKMPPKTREIDAGDAVEIYDEDTNELVMSVPKRMNAFQRETLNLRRQEIAKRGSGGDSAAYQILNTDQGFVAVDKKNLGNKVNLGLKAPKTSGAYDTNDPIIRAVLARLGNVK